MEESNNRGDLLGNVVRQSSLRPNGSLKSTLSGRSSPRTSPSFRRLSSNRTPRRESRISSSSRFECIRGNRLLFWLILITLWAYLGFYVQSKWAHDNNDSNKEDLIGYKSKVGIGMNEDPNVAMNEESLLGKNSSSEDPGAKKVSNLKKINVSLPREVNTVSVAASKKSRRSSTQRSLRSKMHPKQKVVSVAEDQNSDLDEEIPKRNTSYGLIVGPFGKTEDSVLGWSAEKRSGTCNREGDFARIVWSRSFVLIIHELSMTGAPLSMMELATELLSCGATVSVVVLSKKGGLMRELARRGIKVLSDKVELSYKAAMKADLVIAGSAVCSSWIEQYLSRFTAGSNQLVWWIMENRREYFDRSKLMLNRVKMLIFLSDSQSKQWLAWCEEEHIQLNSKPVLVPLSVNDELAFVAGIPCSLNTPSYSVDKMLERRRLLRDAVRKEMGLTDNDMLLMSLSSINPGKGQLLLLESALLAVEQVISSENFRNKGEKGDKSGDIVNQGDSTMDSKKHSSTLIQNVKHNGESVDGLHQSNVSGVTSNQLIHNVTHNGESVDGLRRSNVSDVTLKGRKKKKLRSSKIRNSSKSPDTTARGNISKSRKILSNNEERQEHKLKILIGSIGAKSNKALYIKGILRFLSQHPDLSKLVLWTPATTRVASLYAAADVYVINAQGLGETFGRVTIEAMAFGLPVLGTDAGGTQEIVEHNVTGLLHPIGRAGTPVLAQNLQFLLSDPLARKQMGMKGRSKVQGMFLKEQMYETFARILFKCMKIK